MDFLSKKERGKRMSLIRSKWTNPEKVIHNHLKGNKISHEMHPRLPGNPDILVGKKKVVFIHGCFWHKCPIHYRKPSSNKNFWARKIEKNTRRFSISKRLLKAEGYFPISLWEHELKPQQMTDIIARLR